MQLRQGIWRKSRRAFEASGRAGEVACCDGMCCCPVFWKGANSATCGAPAHPFSDVTPVDNLIRRGGGRKSGRCRTTTKSIATAAASVVMAMATQAIPKCLLISLQVTRDCPMVIVAN